MPQCFTIMNNDNNHNTIQEFALAALEPAGGALAAGFGVIVLGGVLDALIKGVTPEACSLTARRTQSKGGLMTGVKS